jgi:hypothetical protein
MSFVLVTLPDGYGISCVTRKQEKANTSTALNYLPFEEGVQECRTDSQYKST